MFKPAFKTAILFTLIILIGACGSATTDVPPTATAMPPPSTLAPTPAPPKATVMPTATPRSLTNTPIPPTETATPSPTEAATPLPTDTPTPLPPLSGSGGGVIAFTSEIDGNSEIYVMNADGSDQRRLTNRPREDYWPTWSPDGKHIAFASERDGNFEIYVMDADGSNQRPLTNNSADDLEPAWSPNGTQIALMVYSGGKSSIYAMDADGSNRRRLAGSSGNDSLPAWSSDGTQIAFVSDRDGNPEIYVMDADGSNQRRLTNNAGDDSYPAWSPAAAPGGEQISFFSVRDGRRNLYLMDADGSNVRQLTHDDASVWVSAWSPSGTQIAFESERDGTREIYVLAIDEGMDANGTEQGSHLRRLTNNHVLDGTPAWRPGTAHPAAAVPPNDASLGDTWTRPADGMTMVYVPGGEFRMGSTEAQIEAAMVLCQQYYSPCNNWYYGREGPAHAVSMSGFWIDRAEVTNAQYRRCVEDGGCLEPLTCKKGEPTYADPEKTDRPVVCVTWDDARAYCEWAGARLPTEAEWEYAFRGEQGSIYPWGDLFDGSRLNYCDTNCTESHADDEYDDGYANTGPVTSFPQDVSWSGATGMGGNVSEWVADWFGPYSAETLSNPTGPESGNEKMLKGCSWFSPRAYCRGAARPSVDPGARYDYLGFRCAGLPGGIGARHIAEELLTIAVPQGSTPVIDGIIAPGEWASARRELFLDGSELFLMQAGDYLYLGIRASTPGMIAGNVFVEHGGEIAIFHSSAALGTAVYQRGADTWKQVRDFSWSCRDTGTGEAAQAERAAFLRTEHWVAANARMGMPNELEYQIEVSEDTMRLAVVFLNASNPNAKTPWPTDLEDDCTKPTPGGLPRNLDFSPGKWSMLTFVVK